MYNNVLKYINFAYILQHGIFFINNICLVFIKILESHSFQTKQYLFAQNLIIWNLSIFYHYSMFAKTVFANNLPPHQTCRSFLRILCLSEFCKHCPQQSITLGTCALIIDSNLNFCQRQRKHMAYARCHENKLPSYCCYAFLPYLLLSHQEQHF